MLLILISPIQPHHCNYHHLQHQDHLHHCHDRNPGVLLAVGDPSCANAAAPYSTESPSFITLLLVQGADGDFRSSS